jgi:hypothetical protein
MMRAPLAAAALVAALPATAFADTTPGGPATLSTRYTPWVACAMWSGGPAVIVAWQADVGAGGEGGTVRPTFGGSGAGGPVIGDPVDLPAPPGRYTFPAPHLARDMNTCGEQPGLVQTTGNHAVLLRDAPAYQYVNVERDGQPDERIDGARLALGMIVEPDADRDLRGDTTEDRTDLRVTASASRVDAGHAAVTATITNAGPLAADLPFLETSLGGVRQADGCRPGDARAMMLGALGGCLLPAIAPGETRTATLTGDLGLSPQSPGRPGVPALPAARRHERPGLSDARSAARRATAERHPHLLPRGRRPLGGGRRSGAVRDLRACPRSGSEGSISSVRG